MNGQGIGKGGRLRAKVAMLLALSLLASLVLAQTASARTLSERLAVKQATRLLNKQLKDRKRRLVEARISVGERVNSSRWAFAYDDLNRKGDVCTGVIDVRLRPPGGNTVVARFINANCEHPGDEALDFRAASRLVAVAFARKERSVLRSVNAYIDQAQACEVLDVPDNRQDEALLLLNAGLTQATVRPLQSTLDRYASGLQALAPTDTQLAKGAAAWRDYIDGVRSLPKFRRSYCSVLGDWASNNYSDESAPVDFTALRALSARLRADGAEVRRTSRYLTRRGIDRFTAQDFTLNDLIGNTGISSPSARALKQVQAHYKRLAR